MKKLKKYKHLYRLLTSQFLKKIIQSKVDFVIGLLGFICTQCAGLISIYLIMQQIPDLRGWSLPQLLFIYGFAQIPRGIDHLFTDNIWLISYHMIINGEFDRYMLRPMNILFQVIAETLQPDAIGELLVGTVLIIMSLNSGIVIVDGVHIVLFFVSVLAGALIYTAVKLFFASLSFWIKMSGPFLQAAYELADFAKYPTEIYNRPVRFIITWIIPFAFVAYLPARYFLRWEISWTVIPAECLIALIGIVISYAVFAIGTKRYESAGN